MSYLFKHLVILVIKWIRLLLHNDRFLSVKMVLKFKHKNTCLSIDFNDEEEWHLCTSFNRNARQVDIQNCRGCYEVEEQKRIEVMTSSSWWYLMGKCQSSSTLIALSLLQVKKSILIHSKRQILGLIIELDIPSSNLFSLVAKDMYI